MKNIVLNLLLLISTCVFAQENIEKTKLEYEIGVNATLLIKQVLSFSDNKIVNSPYAIVFKCTQKNQGLRIGIGGSLSSANEKQADFADNKTTTNQSANFRIGYELQKKVGKNWKAWIGADFVGAYFNIANETDSGFDRVAIGSSNKSFGGGLAFGTQWHFNEHFSIGSEANINVLFGNKNEYTTFSAGTQNDITKGGKTKDLNVLMPTSIFFMYKF